MTRSPNARHRGFLVLDVLLALSLTLVLAAVLARAVRDQQRAAAAGVRVRHAIDDLETAAARLRAGKPVGDAVTAHATDTGWLRLTPADAATPELFVLPPRPAP